MQRQIETDGEYHHAVSEGKKQLYHFFSSDFLTWVETTESSEENTEPV